MPKNFNTFICIALHKETLQVFFVNKKGPDQNAYLSTVATALVQDPAFFAAIEVALEAINQTNLIHNK